jgi:hypothetical protein
VDSILTSVKKLLGLTEDYTQFDVDCVIHINSALSVLNQLGVGPSQGFRIEDKTAIWSQFIDDPRLENVKTYVYLFVRQFFDPPQNSFAVTAIEKQLEELAWRINLQGEEEQWTQPMSS